MAITKEWLKKAANTQSFSKGQGYYDDVDELIKAGNTYSAVVLGSDDYEVSITDNPVGEPLAHCDCPYDYDGICKHIVAVGLNIIDGNYESEEDEGDENDIEPDALDITVGCMPILPTFNFYDEFFLKKDEITRTVFLRQLFSNDDRLRQQFYVYSKPKVEQVTTAGTDLIEKTAQNLSKKLSKIETLEPDDFYSKGRGRYEDYYDEGDGYTDWINEKIEAIFTPFEADASRYIKNGSILTTTQFFIGLYEGCLGLEFESDTSDYMGEDFETVALNELESMILKQNEHLKSSIFNENDIKASILLVLERWIKRKNATESISFFEDYLIELTNNQELAHWLIKELEERGLTLDLIYLTLANATTIQDDAFWIANAEKIAAVNPDIMQHLLEKYFELNKWTEFHQTAKSALTTFPNNNFVEYLRPKVVENYDEDLYIYVYLKNASRKSILTDFLIVRPLLTQERETEFIKSCRNDNQNLYVEILKNDENLEDILNLIEEKTKSSSFYFYGFDFPKALSYIIKEFPDDVFDIVQRQAEEALKQMKMDRSGYARACAHLRPLKDLPPSHQNDLKTLVNSLRERFKSRPAFLEELSKAVR